MKKKMILLVLTVLLCGVGLGVVIASLVSQNDAMVSLMIEPQHDRWESDWAKELAKSGVGFGVCLIALAGFPGVFLVNKEKAEEQQANRPEYMDD